MKIKKFVFNMFAVNTYILWDSITKDAAIIDPGMINADEEKSLYDFIEANSLHVTHMINTHFHIDHTFGCDSTKQKYNLLVEGNISDKILAQRRSIQARMFGLEDNITELFIDKNLVEGDCITIGTKYLEVIHVPGHSPGSIVLYAPESNILITGDVLFKNSIGRTDLVQGNYDVLIDGITKKLMNLPPNTIVYPGHGDSTTIGEEKANNPYLQYIANF